MNFRNLSDWGPRIRTTGLVLLSVSLAASVASVGTLPSSVEMERLYSVGTLEGDPTEVFGLVQAIAADARGNAFVLDSRMMNVRIIRRGGGVEVPIGRAGAGPGELAYPIDLSLDSRDRLHLLDPGNGRVSVYSTTGESLQLASDFRIPLHGEAICHLGERLFMRAFDGASTIHELDSGGRILHSFGSLSEEIGAMEMDASAPGPIACGLSPHHPGGMLVTGSRFRPELNAYTASGERLWTHHLTGFRQVEMVSRVPGAVTMQQPEEGPHHLITGVHLLPSGRVMVQFGARTSDTRNRQEIVHVETRVLAADGRLSWSSSQLPRIGAIRRDRAYGIQNLPYPQVTVYRIQERETDG